MNSEPIKLQLLTPLFSYGANQNQPEIRAASIRGVLHWWFRALGGTFAQEREVFGGIGLGRNHPQNQELPESASRLVLRTLGPQANSVRTKTYARLPHKTGREAAMGEAFPPGTEFELSYSWRLKPVSEESRNKFKEALDAWLLAGSFGTRATRGAGAIQEIGPFFTTDQWQKKIGELTKQTDLSIHLLPADYKTSEAARHDITNTIGGPFRQDRHNLDKCGNPFGYVKGRNRKTSPLRLTVRRFETGYRIVAVWDGRQLVTGNSKSDLHSAIQLLQDANKPIGKELAKVDW